MYRIFKRTWWKRNPKWPDGREPCAGRKTFIKYVDTIQEAREYCRYWNDNTAPGKLSLKAEFEEA